MVGLVFIDWLQLTPVQWGAIGLNALGWVWCFSAARRWRPDRRFSHEMLAAGLLLSGLWVAFWNAMTCIDEWMLFKEAHALSAFRWEPFVEEVVHRWYVKHQPPLFTYWVSRVPALWVHQLLFFPWAMLCAGLMGRLYGRAAALLLATPVFAILIHQPSNDVLLFGTLLIVLRLCQLSSGVSKRSFDNVAQRRQCPGRFRRSFAALPKLRFGTPEIFLAALLYGLTWMIKPLTILTAPFILPQLGIAGLLSLAMWGGYVGWSLQWAFGRQQLRFLLHQLMISRLKQLKSGKSPDIPLTVTTNMGKFLFRIRGALRWRWTHLGHKAVKALPFYLFPAYLRPWAWQGIVLAVVILFGYGNIKYLLLDLLFLFPVRDEKSVPPFAPFG